MLLLGALIPDMEPYRRAIDLIDAHRKSIREQFACTTFMEGQARYEQWLSARIERAIDKPIELFDFSTARCIENHVLQPAAIKLERLIANRLEVTMRGTWRDIANSVNAAPGMTKRLLSLPEFSTESGRTQLDALRHPPTRLSSNGLAEVEARVRGLQKDQTGLLDVNNIPATRIQQLAEESATKKSSWIDALKEARKVAKLHASRAFLCHLTEAARQSQWGMT